MSENNTNYVTEYLHQCVRSAS